MAIEVDLSTFFVRSPVARARLDVEFASERRSMRCGLGIGRWAVGCGVATRSRSILCGIAQLLSLTGLPECFHPLRLSRLSPNRFRIHIACPDLEYP